MTLPVFAVSLCRIHLTNVSFLDNIGNTFMLQSCYATISQCLFSGAYAMNGAGLEHRDGLAVRTKTRGSRIYIADRVHTCGVPTIIHETIHTPTRKLSGWMEKGAREKRNGG